MLAAGSNDGIAGPVLLIMLIAGAIISAVGSRYARWSIARRLHKNAMAGLPGLRALKWAAFWRMITMGFWVALLFVILVAWAYRDARNG